MHKSKNKSGKCMPDEHWQVNKNLMPEGGPTPAGAFLPTPGKKRPTPHVKTNECDY